MKRLFNSKKLFSTILNIVGMAVALTTFMVIIVQVSWDWGFDDNYPDSDRIYRIETTFASNNFSQNISCPFLNGLKGTNPHVEVLGIRRAPYRQNYLIDETSDNLHSITTIEADADLLKVFPFEFAEGSADGFGTEDRCIISESTAERLFPEESAVGKSIYSNSDTPITVIGVYKDFPENSSIPNGVICAIEKWTLEEESEWSSMGYFKTVEGASIDDAFDVFFDKIIEDSQEELVNLPEAQADSVINSLKSKVRFVNIHDVYFERNMADGLPKGNKFTTDTIFAVAILLILIAIINFINFSMASIPLDIRAVNTKKVLGSTRNQLIREQLAGSLVIVLIAFAISLLMMHVLSGTGIASYISGSLKPFDNLTVILIGLAVAILTSLLAGIYPALYLTSFQPALLLKGSFSLSAKGRSLRNFLVGFQYVISIILACTALFIWVQTKYMKDYDMGFTSDHIIVANIGYNIGSASESFEQKLLENPNITDVTFAGGPLVSEAKMGWGRQYEGEQYIIEVLPVATDFLDFFGISIKEGRNFMVSDELAGSGAFIINESAAAAYPFMTVGNRIPGHLSDENPSEIVGIAYDFNFKPMQYGIGPFALYQFGANPWWPLFTAYIKIAPSGVSDTFEYIRSIMKEFNPNISEWNLELQFLDESIGNMYAKEEKLNRIIVIGAALSLLIALIGILGLVYFETQFSRKGIAVRKVYGASVGELLKDANRRYIILALISFVVATPIAYAIIKAWVRNFPFQASVPVWIFLVTLAVILLITVTVVTLRSYNAANSNPVESLKNE